MSPAQQPYDRRYPAGGPATDYTIADQRAGMINNVGRDQHNSYVTHVLQQRESFLREVAAAKSKARLLIWLGALLVVLGFGGWIYVTLRFIVRIPLLGASDGVGDIGLLGPDVGGVPFGVYALGTAVFGAVLVIIGIVRHVTAAARRRQVDQQLPLPPYYPRYGGPR